MRLKIYVFSLQKFQAYKMGDLNLNIIFGFRPLLYLKDSLVRMIVLRGGD